MNDENTDESAATYDLATRQTVTLNGFEYDVRKICALLDAGYELKAAIKALEDAPTDAAVPNVATKVKKHPYYLARAEMQMNILKAKGPELQQNLLDIALNGRSERNRLEATNSALDRVYGNAKEDEAAKPQFVFNFSFGGSAGPTVETLKVTPTDDLEIIDV